MARAKLKFLPVQGTYVIARHSQTKTAVCWIEEATSKELREMFAEIDRLGLARPILVYGKTCTVSGWSPTWRFYQTSQSKEAVLSDLLKVR